MTSTWNFPQVLVEHVPFETPPGGHKRWSSFKSPNVPGKLCHPLLPILSILLGWLPVFDPQMGQISSHYFTGKNPEHRQFLVETHLPDLYLAAPNYFTKPGRDEPWAMVKSIWSNRSHSGAICDAQGAG